MAAYGNYKQYDSRWSKKNYNGSSNYGTAGCGPTSVANLAYAINTKVTPVTVGNYMKQHGYAIRNNGTAWSGIPAAMKHFGLTDVKNVAKMADVFAYLKKGYCAVFLFRAGSRGGVTWTSSGHYVAVTDIKIQNGKHYLYTRDSGGRNHTGWYAYETTMRGLIPQVWVGKVPTKKTTTKRAANQYQGTLPTKKVKLGDKGEHVAVVQKFLNWGLKGAFKTEKYDKLKVDGICSKKTAEAIKLFKDVNHFPINSTFGPKCIAKAKKMKMTEGRMAMNWAVAISRDNRYQYGTGDRAHHNGCYYCSTNIHGPKHADKGSKWERTYCCNPFVHAAYAHGAGIDKMLKACKSKDAAGLVADDWKKFGFKVVGKCNKVKTGDMKVGDVVLLKSHHVWIYTGSNGIVEATTGWGDKSIAHKSGAKGRMSSYGSKGYVLRRK